MDSSAEVFKKLAQSFNAKHYFKKLTTEGLMDSKLSGLLDYGVDPDSSTVFQCIVNKGTVFYRARIIDPDSCKAENGISFDEEGKLHGFDLTNSAEPPIGKQGPGRNNIQGMSYLYLACDAGTACAEVRPTNHDLISVACFISKRDLRLINFAEDVKIPQNKSEEFQVWLPEFFTLVMNAFRRQVNNDEEYVTTQRIADYIRKAGYDGIEYRSSFTDRPCFTIFNSHKSIIQYKSSTVYFPVSFSREFLEINTDGQRNVAQYSIIESEQTALIEKLQELIKQSIEK